MLAISQSYPLMNLKVILVVDPDARGLKKLLSDEQLSHVESPKIRKAFT